MDPRRSKESPDACCPFVPTLAAVALALSSLAGIPTTAVAADRVGADRVEEEQAGADDRVGAVEQYVTHLVELSVLLGEEDVPLARISRAWDTMDDRIDLRILADHQVILGLHERFLDALTEAKVDEVQLEFIDRVHAVQSRAALIQSIKDRLLKFSTKITTITNPLTAAAAVGGLLRNQGVMSDADNLRLEADVERLQALREERIEAIRELNEVCKEILRAEVDLIRSGELDQDHVPGQDQVRRLHESLATGTPADHVKRLRPLRGTELEHHGAFWFHLGLAQHESGDDLAAVRSLSEYLERELGGQYRRDPLLLPIHVTRAVAARAALERVERIPDRDGPRGDDPTRMLELAFEESLRFLGDDSTVHTDAEVAGLGVTAGLVLLLHGDDAARTKGEETLAYYEADSLPETRRLARDARAFAVATLAADPETPDRTRFDRHLADLDADLDADLEDLGLASALHELRLMHLILPDVGCERRMAAILARTGLEVAEAWDPTGLADQSHPAFTCPPSLRQDLRLVRFRMGETVFEAIVDPASGEPVEFTECVLDPAAWCRDGIDTVTVELEDDLGPIALEAAVRHRRDGMPRFRWRRGSIGDRTLEVNGGTEGDPVDRTALGASEGPLIDLLDRLEVRIVGDDERDLRVRIPRSAGACMVASSLGNETAGDPADAEAGGEPIEFILEDGFDADRWAEDSWVRLTLAKDGTMIEIPGAAVAASDGYVYNGDVDLSEAVVSRDGRRFGIDAESGFWIELN